MKPNEEMLRSSFEKALPRALAQEHGLFITGAGENLVLVARGLPMVRALLAWAKTGATKVADAYSAPTYLIERNPENQPPAEPPAQREE